MNPIIYEYEEVANKERMSYEAPSLEIFRATQGRKIVLANDTRLPISYGEQVATLFFDDGTGVSLSIISGTPGYSDETPGNEMEVRLFKFKWRYE